MCNISLLTELGGVGEMVAINISPLWGWGRERQGRGIFVGTSV